MVEEDVFPPGRRVFLWNGSLFEKMAKKQAHAISSSKLGKALFGSLREGWFLSQECPVEIDGEKVPLPDLSVIRGRPDDYPKRPPTSADVALIVELADSSLAKDLGANLRDYAAARVPVYWVVNLRARRVEVYTDPVAGGEAPGYATFRHFRPGEVVPLVLDGAEIARIPVVDILPAEDDRPGETAE